MNYQNRTVSSDGIGRGHLRIPPQHDDPEPVVGSSRAAPEHVDTTEAQLADFHARRRAAPDGHTAEFDKLLAEETAKRGDK